MILNHIWGLYAPIPVEEMENYRSASREPAFFIVTHIAGWR